MKKTFTGRLRFLVVAMLATITFSFNSCRKDLLVQGPNNLKNALSIAEAKSYFEAYVKVSGRTKTSAVSGNLPVTAESLVAGKRAMWEQAYQKLISTGGAVRIPIDFGNTYAVVNLKKGEVVPLSSLNYLLMYKDSLQAIRLEWVMLEPDSAWLYGARSSYTGRIAVRDWEGRLLKTYWYGTGGKYLVTKGKTMRTASSNEGGMSQPICILVPTGNCPKIGVCSETCDMCTNICAKRFCGWVPFCGIECELPGEPPVGIGSGGVGSTGGGAGGSNSGGGAGPADYPPGCNPDPNYVMPSYPPPGGGTWRLPCGGPETVPIPVPLRLDHNLWTPEETDFLNQNPDIADAITTYLTQNANSEEAREFAKWAVGYLVDFPDANVNELIINNNIPNSSINLPILDTSELTSYPAFKALVEDLPNFLNNYPNILKALEYTTGFSGKKIKQLMQPGKGPKVVVVVNLKDSKGNDITGHYEKATKTLQIDDGYVNGLSLANTPVKYQAIGLILTIATLHEFVHFGVNENALLPIIANRLKDPNYEPGWDFEGNIQPPGAPGYIQPSTAKEWLKYYKIKPKN